MTRAASKIRNAVHTTRHLVHKHRRWFDAATKALHALFNARSGSVPEKVIAGVSIAGSVLEAALPEESLSEMLVREGYHEVRSSIGGFLCDLLSSSEPYERIEPRGDSGHARIWRGSIAATYFHEDHEEGPFVRGGDEQALAELVHGIVWSGGTDVMVTAKAESAGPRGRWRGRGKFALASIPDPGPYVGQRGPDYYVERLRRYGDGPRTVLLVGPTGVGKSVLARHVARALADREARTLKVSRTVLEFCGADEITDLAKWLRPTVMLLDDLPLSGGGRYEEGSSSIDFLESLELLRVSGCTVVATVMGSGARRSWSYGWDDEGGKGKRARGDVYFSGMRPGRVDEVVKLDPPGAPDRRAILNHYYVLHGMTPPPKPLAEAIIKATSGLSGAYLAEVVKRLAAHGFDAWEAEVKDVLYAAPPPPSRAQKRRAKQWARVTIKNPTGKAKAQAAKPAKAKPKGKGKTA